MQKIVVDGTTGMHTGTGRKDNRPTGTQKDQNENHSVSIGTLPATSLQSRAGCVSAATETPSLAAILARSVT